MAALVDAVMACPKHLTERPGLLARERCDALVVDCRRFGARTAAETVGLPMAVLVHSAPGALAAPGGGIERLLLGPVNQVRAVAGRPAVGRLWTPGHPSRRCAPAFRSLTRWPR
jgi:hypothetical protein